MTFCTHLVAPHLLSSSVPKLIFFYPYQIVAISLGEAAPIFTLDALCSLAGRFVFYQETQNIVFLYGNPAVELKELKLLFRKANCHLELPARKAVGLSLQASCQRF